jgi:hypothetical protein
LAACLLRVHVAASVGTNGASRDEDAWRGACSSALHTLVSVGLLAGDGAVATVHVALLDAAPEAEAALLRLATDLIVHRALDAVPTSRPTERLAMYAIRRAEERGEAPLREQLLDAMGWRALG